MSMNKKQPHIKWMFQLSRGAVKNMATQGIGHGKLKRFLDAIPAKPKSEELPPPPKTFGNTEPVVKRKGIKRKGASTTKRKAADPKASSGKRRGRPPKRK